MPSIKANCLDIETYYALLNAALDITGAAMVDVAASPEGEVLWVNVNGVCVLRICKIQILDMHAWERNGSLHRNRNPQEP